MNVGIVTQDDYPSVGEVRPRKLALCLHRAGHRVVFIGWNSRQRKLTEDISYARVYRFPWFLNSRFYSLLATPSPLNPFWVAWIFRAAKQEQLDVLVASNVRIALPAILAAKLLRRPLVLDLQENNPEAMRLRSKTRLIHYLTRSRTLVAALEWLCVNLSDHTWVVVDERIKDLPKRARRRGSISVVSNTPLLEEVPSKVEARAKQDGPFTLIYIGLSGGIGTVELIVNSLPYVLERDRDVRFLIGGDREVEPLVKKLSLQDYVRLDGMIEPEKVGVWLQQGDVGIIAYSVSGLTNTTISNKLFQYMAAGLPVLSTDMVPTRKVLEEVGCGAVIPSGSGPRDVAEIILRMKDCPEQRAVMRRRGREAVLERYHWECEFEHAMSTLERLLHRR